jgi:hypothetical protein
VKTAMNASIEPNQAVHSVFITTTSASVAVAVL